MSHEGAEGSADGALLRELTDHVLPLLPPYEFTVYVLLLRLTRLEGERDVRIGKRSLSAALGTGTRSSGANLQHLTKKLTHLEAAGFIEVGDTTKDGILYRVRWPRDVPAVAERMAASLPAPAAGDYFTDPDLRNELFERDDWRCRYCGAAVTPDTATLDHIVPQVRGGQNDPENLATACLMCNSLKSGRTIEEAAPRILQHVRSGRASPPGGGEVVGK